MTIALRIGGPDAVDAIRIHQWIQRSRPEGYRPEVTVRRRFETGRLVVELAGRIDGVFERDGVTVIEEVKTTRKRLTEINGDGDPVHWGQVTFYAAMYAAEHGLENLELRLIYYSFADEKTREFVRTVSAAEVESFCADIVNRYSVWAEKTVAHLERRDSTAATLEFPYPSFRPGQRRMAAEVYRKARDSGRMFVQAPTGIGKTMAAIYPAVRALGEHHIDRVFYLTARTTGKSVATEALEILVGRGLHVYALVLTAKERICFNPGSPCDPAECMYARGYYDRLNDGVSEALDLDILDRKAIEDLARRHRLCPFEFSLDLALWCDIIIADYNYAFDPWVYLRRFFAERNDRNLFIVDEAHNCVDRARDMFSAELDKRAVLDIRKTAGTHFPRLGKALARINTQLVAIRRVCVENGGATCDPIYPASLDNALRSALQLMEEILADDREFLFRDELTTFYFAVNRFIRVGEWFGERYAFCAETDGKSLRIRLYCLDPSRHMNEAMERASSVVMFSATLEPFGYFREVLGCSGEGDELSLPSPFPQNNLLVAVMHRIQTRYRQRESSKDEVAAVIDAVVGERTGNYMIYFPSYDYLSMVYEAFRAKQDDIECIVQTRDMSESEREAFIGRFSRDNTETLAGFAVLGGVFGEGIDLVGDRLAGAVVVGVGLPGISPERERIRSYFTGASGGGFAYAYRYPGIVRVLQAAGRVIRSERDRGVVVLVDDRFRGTEYRPLLPSWWNPRLCKSPEVLKALLGDFWRGDSGRS